MISTFSPLSDGLEGDDGGRHRHVQGICDAVHGDDDVLVGGIHPGLGDARGFGAHHEGGGLFEVGIKIVDGSLQISAVNGDAILFQPVDALLCRAGIDGYTENAANG